MTVSRLPLPLELTAPVLLADSLDAQMRQAYEARPQLCSSTCSSMQCKSMNYTGVQVDVSLDVQVDDVIA